MFEGLFLEKRVRQPLYQQVYNYVVEAVRAGSLVAGQKLPGKRNAAEQLGVSVNTVDEAYQMLATEGYVIAKPRSGFVVARLQQQLLPPPAGQQKKKQTEDAAEKSHIRYSFATGDIDTSLFARKTYARLLREVMADEEGLYARGEAAGDAVLREAIAEYLQGYRGVKCTAGQIVVGAGLEVLMGMLGPLLGGTVAMETPGYAKTRRILGNVGVRAVPVPVDKQGMLPEALAQSGACAAYLTPSHQFPTGGVMPVGRRTELLRWAAEGERLLVEDDYDSEFRFDGRPLPSLQGLDEGGHVVYAGTFSRSLAPGLRVAYLVLPFRLQKPWRKAYGDYACTVGRPEQHTLARFMAEGHFARSLNRMRGIYRQRRGLVLKALKKELRAGEYEVENEHTGLYFLLRLPGRGAQSIAVAAFEQGVAVHALGGYRLQKRQGEPVFEDKDVLVLGYGGLADEDVAAAVKALAAAVHGGLSD